MNNPTGKSILQRSDERKEKRKVGENLSRRRQDCGYLKKKIGCANSDIFYYTVYGRLCQKDSNRSNNLCNVFISFFRSNYGEVHAKRIGIVSLKILST